MNEQLRTEYITRLPALSRVASALERHLIELLRDQPRIDRISARAKRLDSFLQKAEKVLDDGARKYDEPLEQIQDQIGARIVIFYRQDIERIDQIIRTYFRPIEFRDHIPESEWEFGYFGRHLVLLIPGDVVDGDIDRDLIPRFFELQIKTLFQHAWAEASHDLGYKPGDTPLNAGQKRSLAFTSAQAWGADNVFEELFEERDAEGGKASS